MHLIISTKKSFSAAELQRQLGIACYQTVWEMLHKIRNVMGQRDSKYKLYGAIELDDAFFTISVDEDEKTEPLKRGRGSQRKAKVLVIAESQPSEKIDNRKKVQKIVNHIKMIVIDNLTAPTFNAEVVKWINSNAELTTDDSKSYLGFKELVKSHTSQVVEPKNISKVLPWVHIVISNAKSVDEFLKFPNRRNYVYVDEAGNTSDVMTVDELESNPENLYVGYLDKSHSGFKYVIEGDDAELDVRNIFSVSNIESAQFTKGVVRFHDIEELKDICLRSEYLMKPIGALSFCALATSVRDLVDNLNDDKAYKFVADDYDLVILENH
ncbi:MAG: IS1595 family transposase [Muribaculaceae bacterium]|nr:IS1595 family transposase [Muribaculaceae bacterium]